MDSLAYAVNHKIVDFNTYNFNTEVLNNERCEAEKEMLRGAADEAIRGTIADLEVGDIQECIKKTVSAVENYIIRYVLLIQVDLTDKQRVTERNNFVKDFQKLLDDVIQCIVSHDNEISKKE